MWCRDLTTTPTQVCLGVAKDIISLPGLEIDLSSYVTKHYEDLFRGTFEPHVGVGMSLAF